MAVDNRVLLQLLRFELEFLEHGGYGRSVLTPWKPTSTFQDSPTCLNFGDPQRAHPCSECLLAPLIPKEHMHDDVPCHHIPLNQAGDTVESLRARRSEFYVQAALDDWLRAKIKELEDNINNAAQPGTH